MRFAGVATGTCLLAATLVALVLWPASQTGADASPVRSALAFHLVDVRPSHPAVQLAAKPGVPTVINFFASWCDPCHAELPLIADLARTRGAALTVVGVDVQDNRDLANQLLGDARAGSLPAGYDPERSVNDAWGVDGLPVTVFVAPDGTIVNYHRGQLTPEALNRLVNHLLGTGAPSQHRQS